MKKIFWAVGILIVLVAAGVPVGLSLFILPRIRAEATGGFPRNAPRNSDELKTYVYDNTEPWVQKDRDMKYLGYRLITDAELAKLKNQTDLTPRYPETLKALFNPGGITNTTDLLYFADELKDLGVNTYWVIGEYRIENNKLTQFMPSLTELGLPSVLAQADANKMLEYRLLLAKKQGLATILVPDIPSATEIGRSNFDLKILNPEFERLALELAGIAEKYQAEYLSPINEYEHLLYSNGYSVEEIAKLERAFYDDLIPKIRKIYKGKILIKCGNVGDWPNFTKLSMKGADLFGVGNAYAMEKGKIAEDMTAKAIAADQVSKRDNTPWIESEFLVYRPIDQENWMGKVYSTYPMENSYEEGTKAFAQTAKKAVGFSFMSWTGVGRIRGTVSASVLKNFFATWRPAAKLQMSVLPEEYIPAIKPLSVASFFKNIGKIYALTYGILTGKMGPQQKDKPMGMAGPGGCKGKAECEAYCGVIDHAEECMNFKPGGGGGASGGAQQPPVFQGGPGGCKTQAECDAYCSNPANRDECLNMKRD